MGGGDWIIRLYSSNTYNYRYPSGQDWYVNPSPPTNVYNVSHNNQAGQECGFHVGMTGWSSTYSRHKARFSFFRCIKNGVMFHLFLVSMRHSFECMNQTTINKPIEDAFSSGLRCFLGGGGWVGPTWEQFLSRVVVSHIPSSEQPYWQVIPYCLTEANKH